MRYYVLRSRITDTNGVLQTAEWESYSDPYNTYGSAFSRQTNLNRILDYIISSSCVRYSPMMFRSPKATCLWALVYTRYPTSGNGMRDDRELLRSRLDVHAPPPELNYAIMVDQVFWIAPVHVPTIQEIVS